MSCRRLWRLLASVFVGGQDVDLARVGRGAEVNMSEHEPFAKVGRPESKTILAPRSSTPSGYFVFRGVG